jgi:hypothetical protein
MGMNLNHLILAVCLGLLMGCSTPVEIKQVLAAKDQQYAANLALMEQYRQLVEQVNARFQYWYRHIAIRHKLNLALAWATTDLKGETVSEQDFAGMAAELLGPSVRELVNTMRLHGLPARTGPDGQVLFEAGRSDMTGLIKGLPALIARVGKQVDMDFQQATEIDLSPYDDYRTNVEALRRIHSMVKAYLEIDVTVKRDDIRELSEVIRSLR